MNPRGTVVAGVRTERKLSCREENVSDHLDAPGLKSPNMDARIDITDIFAFQNPADPTRSVLAMNVNPVAPTLADSFAPEAVYELILDKNVFSMVLEMPNKALGEGQVGFWCRVLGPENGDLSQIDRMGRPLTNMLYTEGEDKNAFNQVGPEQDRDLFLETFKVVLEANGYGSGEARTVVETLLPDVLTYEHRAAAAFPNGRRLDDAIVDAALDLFTNGRITSDGVSPHRDMLYSFPYLGAPHSTPDGSTEGDA